jgi:hypothetical protein
MDNGVLVCPGIMLQPQLAQASWRLFALKNEKDYGA